MRIKTFIEFSEKKKPTIYDKITDDPNEFVATDPDSFIEQDIEIDNVDRSKDVGRDVIRADRKNNHTITKQKFNSGGGQKTLMN